MESFEIPFKGLANGNHRYFFEIGKAFLGQHAIFETDKGKVKITLDLEKEATLMVLRFTMDGYLVHACDRCLAEFDLPVKGEFKLIVKFGDVFEEESDEVIIIPSTESRFDISQYVFESISLLLPIKKVHPDISQCDPSFLEKMGHHDKGKTDPRWDALKDIKLKE